MRFLFAQIMPFVMAGIALVAFFFGLILLAYLFIFGAVIGLGLFIAAWIKNKFFPSTSVRRKAPVKSGRIIDHEDK